MRCNAHQRSRTLPFLAVLLPATLLIIASSACGDDFWKHKRPSEWSRAEALKILRNSPWAKVEIVVSMPRGDQPAFSIPTGTNHCDPDAIDPNGNCMQKNRVEVAVDESRQLDAAPQISPSTAFLVVWQSEIVAQAFARLRELGDRTIIAFQAERPRVPVDRYVISVKLEQPGRAGFAPFAVTPAGKPVLQASLRTERGTVDAFETEFTGVGASAAVHFFFPRTINGNALLGPDVRLAEFGLVGRGFAIRTHFKIDAAFLQTATPN